MFHCVYTALSLYCVVYSGVWVYMCICICVCVHISCLYIPAVVNIANMISSHLYERFQDPLNDLASTRNMEIRAAAHYLDFIQGSNIVRISREHLIYAVGIIESFHHYFSAVASQPFSGYNLVDYSTGKYQTVRGFDLMPIYFPSFAEPMSTTESYLDFARILPGSTVLDLGAYAGHTSIIFKELAGAYGRVVALDADPQNIRAIRKNFQLYSTIRNHGIDLVYGAIWRHGQGIAFSSESNMGSSAAEIVGSGRGHDLVVPSFTLTSLAARVSLTSVDFIKCDVEGAESAVFEDAEFFAKFRPRILVETHMVGGASTAERVTQLLTSYGYTCRPVELHQIAGLPILECTPN